MKRITTIIALALLTALCAHAQNTGYIATLQDILRGSAAETSISKHYTADSLGYRRGLNPADPEFEIAYFFKGNFEANLSTELDMPSLYHQRNVLSKLNTEKSGAESRLSRLTVLSEISDSYLELAYNTQLGNFLSGVFESDSIAPFRERLKKALEDGDITALDYADLQMVMITLTDALEESRRQKLMLTERIRMYSPGFSADSLDFPAFSFGDLTRVSFVGQALAANPETDMLEKDSLVHERELKLAKWEWAPKIVVGARLDMDENRNFAPAALAGLSIPLWENRGNIRHAKARTESARAERERSSQELRNALEELYTRYSTSGSMIRNWDGYDVQVHAAVLRKAYNAGKITSSEYFLQFSKVLENAVRILELEHEHAACAARMTLLLNGNDI